MNIFEKEHALFISYIKESFKDVENFYRVTIPIAEIGYIYDYVRNDKNFIERGFCI